MHMGRHFKGTCILLCSSLCHVIRRASFDCFSSARLLLCAYSSLASSQSVEATFDHRERCDANLLIAKVHIGGSPDEVVEHLRLDQECQALRLSDTLVDMLLCRFKDDWKSAMGVFRWAGSHSNYKHTPEAYDMMVDILGKMKQMGHMRALLEEMREGHLVSLQTVGKAMRRFCGAGMWQAAVRLFDELEDFGVEKNTKSMNLLLDTLCKERKVELAREIFLELKPHISPDLSTFNIFIHGWSKAGRVDEAYWTIQEMKGYGCHPCVISYSTIIQHHCQKNDFVKVYELLDEMEGQGLPANVVTYTTIMSSLAQSKKFEEALKIAERMKQVGCKPDALFYNSLIHSLGKAGRIKDAVHVFKVEMPATGVLPTTSTYNTLIAMFCHQAQESRALNLLKEMEASMICRPDRQTYYPLLKSCFRTGKIDSLLRKLLDDMVMKHHLSLDVSAYMLLIHGLCRANKSEWAYSLFEELVGQDMKPKYLTCRVLLEEVRSKNMYDAAEKIEAFMKNL